LLQYSLILEVTVSLFPKFDFTTKDFAKQSTISLSLLSSSPELGSMSIETLFTVFILLYPVNLSTTFQTEQDLKEEINWVLK